LVIRAVKYVCPVNTLSQWTVSSLWVWRNSTTTCLPHCLGSSCHYFRSREVECERLDAMQVKRREENNFEHKPDQARHQGRSQYFFIFISTNLKSFTSGTYWRLPHEMHWDTPYPWRLEKWPSYGQWMRV
jgi:hypothetical protein